LILSGECKSHGKKAPKYLDNAEDMCSNMPIRWHNQEMIVHEAVIIAPPYRPEDCKCQKEKQETLNRVKKVLEGERRKLKDKEDRDKRAATPTGFRKGG